MHPEGTGLAEDTPLDDVGDFFQAHFCFLGEIRDCLCTGHMRHMVFSKVTIILSPC